MTVTDDLTDRLLEHLGHVCVTGEEGPIADAVAARYQHLGEPVARVGDSLVIGRPEDDRPLVLLVGHLDVVPPTPDDLEPRVEERDGRRVVVGRGASDMKAGNVVAMSLFEDDDVRSRGPYSLALVLYAAEEGGAEENQLADVLEEVTWLRDAGLAVVLEPTDGEVQVGCLGGLHAVVTVRGRQAHSARPWHGDSALLHAARLLLDLADHDPTPVEVDGITYHDVLSATQAWTTNARNVLPGEAMLNLNYRFAPSRGLEEAERELRDLVGGRGEVEITDRAPEAPPRLDDPLVATFVDAVDAPLQAKQAWTDVARFAAVGVPGVNYGPGLTSQAHQRGEYVPVDALTACHARLRGFLLGG